MPPLQRPEQAEHDDERDAEGDEGDRGVPGSQHDRRRLAVLPHLARRRLAEVGELHPFEPQGPLLVREHPPEESQTEAARDLQRQADLRGREAQDHEDDEGEREERSAQRAEREQQPPEHRADAPVGDAHDHPDDGGADDARDEGDQGQSAGDQRDDHSVSLIVAKPQSGIRKPPEDELQGRAERHANPRAQRFFAQPGEGARNGGPGMRLRVAAGYGPGPALRGARDRPTGVGAASLRAEGEGFEPSKSLHP